MHVGPTHSTGRRTLIGVVGWQKLSGGRWWRWWSSKWQTGRGFMNMAIHLLFIASRGASIALTREPSILEPVWHTAQCWWQALLPIESTRRKCSTVTFSRKQHNMPHCHLVSMIRSRKYPKPHYPHSVVNLSQWKLRQNASIWIQYSRVDAISISAA